MRASLLRRFRILISSLILFCFILVFIDFKNLIPVKYVNTFLWLQFIPSVLKFIQLKTIIATGGFVAVLLLTFITGRSYCSFLCPLGILQDSFSRLGGMVNKKFRKYKYDKPFTVIRYSIFAACLIIVLVWGIYPLTLLDPYSIFGRIITYFGKPFVLFLNNLISGIFHLFDLYILDIVPLTGFYLISYSIPVFFLLLIGILSFSKGRHYCNIVCPVGTLFGLLSKVSVFKIKFDEKSCIHCGKCAVRCKSSCIDFHQVNVDLTRCVVCFNCIDACSGKVISYGFVKPAKKVKETDLFRRKFFSAAIAFFSGIPLISESQAKRTPVPGKSSTVKEKRIYPVCPPGAVSIARFNNNCTACSLCISACPNEVLQPAMMQYGLIGMMQPVMDYHKSFCTFNCTKCSEICPTFALQPLALEAKQLTQIGKSVFIKDNCIVKTEETACGACSESCPTKAVYMVLYKGNLLIPETNAEICIGCGHCEYACPTKPYKAIFVDGNPIHKIAKKPENKPSEIKIPTDFPF